jgi:hypothetical protein
MDFVSWDDDIPNIWKVIRTLPNHQPDDDFNDFLWNVAIHGEYISNHDGIMNLYYYNGGE